jgi:4-hydroxyphenylpyruvate dioxygenase
MGPFPHDAPPAIISADNPMGTDGFEFVEYAHPRPEELHALFKLMGFAPVARHRTKKITVYRQGDINYLVNEEPGTHGFNFVAEHGPCAPWMAFRVVDATQACERAISLGAEPAEAISAQKTLDVPLIKGIGGSLLYLVDRYSAKGSAYGAEFDWLGARDPRPVGAGGPEERPSSIYLDWKIGKSWSIGTSFSLFLKQLQTVMECFEARRGNG